MHKLLYPVPGDDSRIAKLHEILERTRSAAHVTCYWRREPGEAAPQIPDRFKSAIKPLAPDLECDFAQVQSSGGRSRRDAASQLSNRRGHECAQ